MTPLEEGDDVAVGARVQFQAPHGETWMPGVVVGHGLQSAGKGRPCDIIDDHGVLWEKIPAGQVHGDCLQSQERRPRDAPMELLSTAGRNLTSELSSRREGLFAELMHLRDRLRFRREEEDEPEVPEEQEHEEDEEEDEDDEEESEQPPGSGGEAAAMAAISGALGSRPPSDVGSASPPSLGFAGLSNAVAALSGPRSPSPPFGPPGPGSGPGRPDEELRMLERFRSLEQILPEQILAGPMSGGHLRFGTGDGVLEIRRIFEGDGNRRSRDLVPGV